MKGVWIIGFIVIFLVGTLGVYFFIESPLPTPTSIDELCANAGEAAFLSSGPPFKECCEGLKEIGGGTEEYWQSYDENNNGVIDNNEMPDGGFTLCSKCGNDICESWEHKYSCPEDCQ